MYLESTLEKFANNVQPEALAARFRQIISDITPLDSSAEGDDLYTHKQLEDAANEDELDIDLLMELHKLRERALYEVLEEEGDDDDWDLDEALEEFNEADNVILVDQDTDGGTKEWGIQTDGDPEEWEI